MPERGREWGQRSSLALAKKKLFALNHFFCGLTPELSRAESGEAVR